MTEGIEAAAKPATITAAVLIIGDEILSGRTKDRNGGYIAEYLTAIGIDLREVRVVPDVEDEIVDAVNALRARYTYVFTTGGIGPTHDDITADAIARAFGVSIDEDPRAIAMLLEYIRPEDMNAARRRMARIPAGARLVVNPISKAPGFWIGNVIVMAGIPAIMQVMLDNVAPQLATGVPMMSRTVRAACREGDVAADLATIAANHGTVSIGSYPFMENGQYGTHLVLRSRDAQALEAAHNEVIALVARMTLAAG
ncbi:molybdenum cofactor synthesis domain-containing protein [Pseudochelatococcus lubricantis]|uniref:Molybdenum cofactor synthesis domain-containing protein n=1 Tax=Pseudochelatococcus lubricantis TaxID=1538102 RepID=A0ABX0UW50_9HYPH|nr:molybdopterin-binding protein [Pseudochelatococcus lubricantis]NIJ56489.1 molybdenum cofactor synthesis domain-containing protein [Pseudochelatococcus lubricantis]